MEGPKPNIQVFPHEECAVCLGEGKSLVVFLNCGHACVCTECDAAHKLLACPLDRQPIEARMPYVKDEDVANANAEAEKPKVKVEVMPADFLISRAEFIKRHAPLVTRDGNELVVDICHAFDFEKGVIQGVFDEFFPAHKHCPTSYSACGTMWDFTNGNTLPRENVSKYSYREFFAVYPRADLAKLRDWIIGAFYSAYREQCSRRAAASSAK